MGARVRKVCAWASSAAGTKFSWDDMALEGMSVALGVVLLVKCRCLGGFVALVVLLAGAKD